MDFRIVSTAFDGTVRVTCPAPEIHAVMTHGGGYFHDSSIGMTAAIKYEIEKQINNGRHEKVTHKFVDALAFGGLTDAEFFEIIRDRDCAPWGTAHELWHVDDVPKDRWFRDAWRRSHNGGPIIVDLEKARLIQIERIEQRLSVLEKRQPGPLMKFITPKMKKARFNLKAMATRIGEARDEYELRHVWPEAIA